MMGDLSWPCASSSSTFWTNRHDDPEGKFFFSNSISTSFNPVQALHKDQQQLLATSNSQRITQQAFSSLDCSNQSAGEEALVRWEEMALGTESSSPSLFNKPYMLKPQSGIASNLDMPQMAAFSYFDDQPRDYGFIFGSKTYADTSVEEDGVSIIVSGESENHGSKAKNTQFHDGFHQSSTDGHNQYLQGRFPDTKPGSRKRSSDQIEIKNTGFDFVPPFLSSCTAEGGFRLISESSPKRKKQRLEKLPKSTSINFQQQTASSLSSSIEEPDPEAIAQMKEMIYRAAAFRPVNLGLEAVERPKRKNVRISTDPQTVAARQRRERIGERIRVLQRLVPGGSKMDTASMLEEAANYLKFLKSQIKALENVGQEFDSSNNSPPASIAFSFNPSLPMQTHSSIQNPNQVHSFQK